MLISTWGKANLHQNNFDLRHTEGTYWFAYMGKNVLILLGALHRTYWDYIEKRNRDFVSCRLEDTCEGQQLYFSLFMSYLPNKKTERELSFCWFVLVLQWESTN